MNTFENIMENEAFAPKEQMLHFPSYFQICDNSSVSKGIIMELRIMWDVVRQMDGQKFEAGMTKIIWSHSYQEACAYAGKNV